MKRYLLSLFFILLTLFSVSQGDSSLQRRLDEYMLLNKQLNFDKLMDYIHPRIFTLVTKEQMVEMFQLTFNNEDIILKMDSLSVNSVSSDFNFKESFYRKVDYYVGFSMRFKDTSILKDKELVPFLKMQMKASMGAENVNYIESENCLFIDSHKILIAIKDDEKTDWMFLGYEPKQAKMMEILIPSEVLKNFKL